jgi:PAS domain S-box-containing protein
MYLFNTVLQSLPVRFSLWNRWQSRLQSYLDALAKDELIARQRFRLFSVTTLTAGLVILVAFIQSLMVMESGLMAQITSGIIGVLGLALLANYIALPFHQNHRFAYYAIVLAAFVALHFITYDSGGIRASAIMYMVGVMLLAFMLLGNTAGRTVFLLIAAHIIYFWFISVNTNWVGYELIGSDTWSINLDYMATFLLAMVILTAQMNYLESGKNEVISRITEQRNELTLKNRELNKLSMVASKADNAIAITDAAGLVEWVNDGFLRLTACTSDEILGKNIISLCLPDKTQSSSNHEEWIKAFNAITSFSGELEQARKDGTAYWVQMNMTPILSDDEGRLQYILIGTDITKRKVAEEQTHLYMRNLEKTNAELDKFAYVVSHDLKAPLRAIGSLTGWIEEDMGAQLPEEMRGHLTTIQGRVVRMEGLINGILDYTKAAKKEEDRVDFEVSEMVNETIDLLGPPAHTEIRLHGNWPRIRARKIKMQQVFINLIQNAMKYNDKAEMKIDVGCRLKNGDWEFFVKDNGPGIEPRYHHKIFEIFQTLNARDEVESRGVGLAIVKKLVEEEGGSIHVESELGAGACFVFVWPDGVIDSGKTIGAVESARNPGHRRA